MATATTAKKGQWLGPLDRLFIDFFVARKWRGRPYLISPFVDFMMVGGLALMIIPLLALFVPLDVRNDVSIRQYSVLLAGMVTYHVFAINYPHFAYSYQIAYSRFPSRLKDPTMPRAVRWRYIFALLGFPLMFAAYCAYALTTTSLDDNEFPVGVTMLGLLVNLMYATVGWHYCKQSFGMLMVLSALKGLYFSKWERRVLLINAIMVWMASMIGANIGAYQHQYWGLPYGSMMLGKWLPVPTEQMYLWNSWLREGVVIMSLLSLTIILYNGWRTKKRPSATGTLGFFTMYPMILIGYQLHPFWFWIVPALHSMQYLLFVMAYKRNEIAVRRADREAAEIGAENRSMKPFRFAFAMFVAIGVVIGAAQFSWIPHAFDALVSQENKYHIPAMFMALFHLFVNIHHYFIDNVIWRKENPEVGKYLMHRG